MVEDAYGPTHRNLVYCIRCCLPETSESMVFDEMGMCRACQSSEQKMHIDWKQREKELRKILEHARATSGDNYDCIVPISGGKDSSFQLHVLVKAYGMKPLAVTFSHNWYSDTGRYNLWNILEKLNVDHLMFTPNRSLVNRLAKRSLYAIGDSCWHCHAGIGAYPLQMAIRLDIPLMVWGESTAEGPNCKESYADNDWKKIKFDENYYLRISTKVHPDKMVGEDITRKDLYPFKLPSGEEVKEAGIVGIHLGDYMFWDGERQVEFLTQEYDWREDKVEGAYKGYKSVECRMPGVHDYAKFIKRGFGRITDQVCIDVRAGLMTREQGFELIRKLEAKRPEALDYYLEITGLSEEEFHRVLRAKRTGAALKIQDD